jgi:hypothetical protein
MIGGKEPKSREKIGLMNVPPEVRDTVAPKNRPCSGVSQKIHNVWPAGMEFSVEFAHMREEFGKKVERGLASESLKGVVNGPRICRERALKVGKSCRILSLNF